ncbi:MAG: DUF885 domain-containing protein [Janthinobacterium lividum]
MKLLFLAALAALALAGCQAGGDKPAAATGDNQALGAFFGQYWVKQSKFFPLEATAQGDSTYNNVLPNDQTRAFRDSLGVFYQQYLTGLAKYDRNALSENDKISYDIFQYELQQRQAGLRQPTWMLPFNQFWGLPLTLGQYGSGQGNQPFKTVKDYDDWLGRVHGFPAWADSAIGNFRQGMRLGVVLPKTLVAKMVPQMRGQDIDVSDPTKSLFYGPIKRLPARFSAADKARLTKAYQQAIMTDLVPAYRKLGNFLAGDYRQSARTTSGIAAIPGGPGLYSYDVAYWTTTTRTPQDIYETGLAEVARIKGEMEKVKTQVGFQGDLPAFFTYLRTNPKFKPYQTPEQVLAAFHKIQETSAPNLKKLFGRTPKTPFEIRETEKFREASASAEYNQGSPDGSRPGVFYVPIPDAKQFNTTSGMESLFLHEAIPGHHYQISLQQENHDLPKFRQFAWYGAMGEGWALYSESLGKELGLYTDPYQYMGALGDEMHRAVRLVVDTGLHSRGMSREDAIKYMMANEPLDEAGVTAEIERYMAIPGQALSYKVGALKIKELRAKYQQQLGSKFDLRAFHDELLKDGVMPLTVLERKMDAWAKTVK